MKLKTAFILFTTAFVCLCGFFVMESGLFDNNLPAISYRVVPLTESITVPLSNAAIRPAVDRQDMSFLYFTAKNAKHETVIIGSDRKEDNPFKFQLELSSLGASISSAALSEYEDRNSKDPKPLKLLSTVERNSSRQVSSLANSKFVVNGQGLDLSNLDWSAGSVITNPDGSQSVTFEAIVLEKFELKANGGDPIFKDAVKIKKVYTVVPGSYDVQLSIDVENLADSTYTTSFSLQGPAGVGREGTRQDMRAIVAGYVDGLGQVESVKRDNRVLRKAAKSSDKEKLDLSPENKDENFIWATVTNKYFAAILRPVPQGDADFTSSVKLGRAQYYDPGIADKKPDGDEDISFTVSTVPVELAPAGQEGSSKSLDFQIFLGPKKKNLFQENALYKKLGYIQTLSFMPCICCPNAIINPLSFAIMAIMKGMYFVVHNYGVVIILLVLLIRLVLHPVTKYSQVSMMRMQKISSHPRMIEIKTKYSNDRQEQQRQMMAFYREQNVSPAAGMVSMLPMMLQMPIWIALYRAIYANIELRGAAFLPFWITDLSSPDALITFSKAITIPLVGWQIESFNLLPVLLGIAMFLQQKLMPHQTNAQTDPQIAQQQKMMMIMMPFMMLIFLYSAPSGLNLYIMASTFGGVFEQSVIRKHIREKEAQEEAGKVAVTKKAGGKAKKKKPKPFMKY